MAASSLNALAGNKRTSRHPSQLRDRVRRGWENTLNVSFVLEVSQSNGATFRLGLGCKLHLVLITTVAAMARLF